MRLRKTAKIDPLFGPFLSSWRACFAEKLGGFCAAWRGLARIAWRQCAAWRASHGDSARPGALHLARPGALHLARPGAR